MTEYQVFTTDYDASTGECWQCYCQRHEYQHTNGPCRCSEEWKAKRRAAKEAAEQVELGGESG